MNEVSPESPSTVVARCDICQSKNWYREEMKHLPIYISGSEGVNLCPDCMLSLTEHLRHIRSAAARSYNARPFHKQA